MTNESIGSGLEGVVVADTELSLVDGSGGRLVLRGHSLEAIAGVRRFSEVCGLLWTGRSSDDGALARALGEGRAWAWDRRARWEPALDSENGMDALRAGVGRLDEEGRDTLERGARLVGAVGVIGGAWGLARRGQAPLAPDPAEDHAADLLRMARGRPASSDEAAALDRYLVTVIDHGMNASTFAARVVTSTGSDAVSAFVAAIGALKGPLHGGAPGPVLDMLDAIGSAERAPEWIRGELAAGRRIMGMGHRVYRTRDPRAAVLERAIEALDRSGRGGERLALAREVEASAEAILAERHPSRPLRANVEFYTAVLLETLGLERGQLTPTFAAGRAAGWWAHVLEQRASGRLIRPSARYVGPEAATTQL